MEIYLNSPSLILPMDYNADAIHKIRVYCAVKYNTFISDDQNRMIFKAYHRSAYENEEYVDIGDIIVDENEMMKYHVPFTFYNVPNPYIYTEFNRAVSSKIVYDVVKELCGDSQDFILANREIFIYGDRDPVMKNVMQIMVRYLEFVCLNEETWNCVEANDGCLMRMHNEYGLDYIEFFEQLSSDWNILIKKKDIDPVKRLVEKAILLQVKESSYREYCKKADEANYYRSKLRKKKEEETVISSRAIMDKNHIFDKPTEPTEPTEPVEDDNLYEEYLDYSVESETQDKLTQSKKPNSLKSYSNKQRGSLLLVYLIGILIAVLCMVYLVHAIPSYLVIPIMCLIFFILLYGVISGK